MYAKIVNEETKQCDVGTGTNTAFYQSIGMSEMEVEQAYNGQWYLKGYAPEKPAEQKEAAVRTIRNQYLYDTDMYIALSDYPITDEQREEYKAYRVYLRTYPECQEWYESNPLTFDEWVQAKELATESKLNYLDAAQEMNDGTIQSGEGDISVSDEVVSDNTDTE